MGAVLQAFAQIQKNEKQRGGGMTKDDAQKEIEGLTKQMEERKLALMNADPSMCLMMGQVHILSKIVGDDADTGPPALAVES